MHSSSYSEHLLRTPHPPATEQTVDCTWLFDLFGNDIDDLIHYLSMLIANWKQAHINLQRSVDNQDRRTYATILHQLLPTMKLLHLDELLTLLKAGELQIDQSNTSTRSTYFNNVLTHFDRVIAVLQEQKEQLIREQQETQHTALEP